jgi:hypothetical protein
MKKDHNYYILTTKYVNTDIKVSYILMCNIVYICATIYKQLRSNKKIYFYMVEIDSKIKKKVDLNYINSIIDSKILSKIYKL